MSGTLLPLEHTRNRAGGGQAGFTIVELLIATLIFSIILVGIIVAVLQFSRSYYHGVNSASTQATARNVIDTISQAIQFTGQQVQTAANVVCIGNQRYSYHLGMQLEPSVTRSDQSTTALYKTPFTTGSCTASFSGGQELLNKGMRLSVFSVTSTDTEKWNINVRITYGDLDLLCAPTSSSGSCKNSGALTSAAQTAVPDITCKNYAGSEYCATAGLSTTVVKRIP